MPPSTIKLLITERAERKQRVRTPKKPKTDDAKTADSVEAQKIALPQKRPQTEELEKELTDQ